MNAISYASGRFSPDNENLAIWLRNEPTDTAATKSFSRTGGFKGTATNATYIVKRLTAEFGPVGHGWGVDVVAEDMFEGAPVRTDDGTLLGHEKVHRLRVRFWWLDAKTGKTCGFDQMGQTTFVGRNRNGWFTDEEAPKKSLTDALTKAASWLGFAADIHLGLWDDSKYVAERRQAEDAPPPMSLWVILSRDGVAKDCGSEERFRTEWKMRVSAVAKAQKPAEKRIETLRAMHKANADVLAELREEGHEDAPDAVAQMIERAVAKIVPTAPAPEATADVGTEAQAAEMTDEPAPEPPPHTDDDIPSLPDEPNAEAERVYRISTAKGDRTFTDRAEWIAAWRDLIAKCQAAKAFGKLSAAMDLNHGNFLAVEAFDIDAVAQVRGPLFDVIGSSSPSPDAPPADFAEPPPESDKDREWVARMKGEIAKAGANPGWWREKVPGKVARLAKDRPELLAELDKAEADRVAELVTADVA